MTVFVISIQQLIYVLLPLPPGPHLKALLGIVVNVNIPSTVPTCYGGEEEEKRKILISKLWLKAKLFVSATAKSR